MLQQVWLCQAKHPVLVPDRAKECSSRDGKGKRYGLMQREGRWRTKKPQNCDVYFTTCCACEESGCHTVKSDTEVLDDSKKRGSKQLQLVAVLDSSNQRQPIIVDLLREELHDKQNEISSIWKKTACDAISSLPHTTAHSLPFMRLRQIEESDSRLMSSLIAAHMWRLLLRRYFFIYFLLHIRGLARISRYDGTIYSKYVLTHI